MITKSIVMLLIVLSLTLVGGGSAAAYLTEPDNPAELAISESRFKLILPVFGFSAGNNLFNFDNVNADLTTAEAKRDFLARLDGGEFHGDLATQLQTGITIGHFSAMVRPWFSGSVNLKSGIPQLIFEGYQAGQTYELNGSKAEGIAAGSLDLSYGRTVWRRFDSELSAGLTLHYLHGLAVGQSVVTASDITVDEWGQAGYSAEVDSFYGSLDDEGFSGEGYLLDLGLLYQNQSWTAGLVLKNIGPALNWQGLTHEYAIYEGEIIGGPDGPDLPEPDSTTTETGGAELSTRIPLVVHVYGGYQLSPKWRLNLGLEQGLEDAWGISTDPLLYTGLEWRPWKSLRMIGNVYSFRDQLGVETALQGRAKFFLIQLAAGWSGGLDPDQATDFHTSFGVGFGF
jgi:hypothetical protein